jgi:nicotinamide-nucleotide amidase
MDKQIIELAILVGQSLVEKNLIIATAESCTGGGVAQAITEIPGSSAWFDRGFVTYSNLAKMQMLQVDQVVLDQHGAVSEEVAKQMVEGALNNSDADFAVSVTGIAGPSGGSEKKPVGTVYIAWGIKDEGVVCEKYFFSGDRSEVRKQTIISALKGCLEERKRRLG